MLDDGDLDLTEQYERHSYREFFDHPEGLWRQSVPNDDGRLLSPHNPGLPVLLMPGFALDGLRGTQVQLVAIAAATFALAYVLVARITRVFRSMGVDALGRAHRHLVHLLQRDLSGDTGGIHHRPPRCCSSPRVLAWVAVVVAALLTTTMWLSPAS